MIGMNTVVTHDTQQEYNRSSEGLPPEHIRGQLLPIGKNTNDAQIPAKVK